MDVLLVLLMLVLVGAALWLVAAVDTLGTGRGK